jgi:hypothetical protein
MLLRRQPLFTFSTGVVFVSTLSFNSTALLWLVSGVEVVGLAWGGLLTGVETGESGGEVWVAERLRLAWLGQFKLKSSFTSSSSIIKRCSSLKAF